MVCGRTAPGKGPVAFWYKLAATYSIQYDLRLSHEWNAHLNEPPGELGARPHVPDAEPYKNTLSYSVRRASAVTDPRGQQGGEFLLFQTCSIFN